MELLSENIWNQNTTKLNQSNKYLSNKNRIFDVKIIHIYFHCVKHRQKIFMVSNRSIVKLSYDFENQVTEEKNNDNFTNLKNKKKLIKT